MHDLYCRWNRSIAKRYGRKRAFVLHYIGLLIYTLGGYRRFVKIEWDRVTRLVFVCKGNICRSPYAEAKARALGLNANSCGLRTNGVRLADTTAIRIAGFRDVDLTPHRSHDVQDLRLGFHDLLIGMEPWHAREVLSLSKSSGAQVTLLGLWGDRPHVRITDPLGLVESYYCTCFSVIDNHVEEIVELMKMYGPSTQASDM